MGGAVDRAHPSNAKKPSLRAIMRNESATWKRVESPRLSIVEIGKLLVVYVICRAVVTATISLYPSNVPVAKRFEAFDASYYAAIVQHGYPKVLPPGQSVIGFFPGYPLVVRAVDDVFRTPVWLGLVAVSLASGAIATVLLAEVARQIGYKKASNVPAVLWQALPISCLLSIGYSEGLFVALSALCLLWLLRRRWVLASLCAACAAATHPTGVVFVLVGLIAAFTPERHRFQVRALGVSAGALSGIIAFCLYLKFHVGSFSAYFTSKRQGWGNHEDFGEGAAKFVGRALIDPTLHPWWDVVTVSMALVLVLLISMIKTRMPAVLLGYVLGILFLATTFGIASMTSFPRIAFAAFPLFFPLSRWFHRRKVALTVGALGLSLALAAFFGVIVTTTHYVTP
jgi:hypothetical protein